MASKRIGIVLVSITCLLGLVPSTLYMVYNASFRVRSKYIQCLGNGKHEAHIAVTMIMVLILVLPLVVILVLNMTLSIIAIRHSKSRDSRYKALITTCSLSGLFIASWVPYIVYITYGITSNIPLNMLDVAASHGIYLNSCCNPILYTLTHRSFSRYIKRLITCKNGIGPQNTRTNTFSSTRLKIHSFSK